MYKFLPIAFVVMVASAKAQTTSVLFLGNSYTYTANLPGMLYSLALAGGDTIYHESNTPGGYTFQNHSTNATSLSKIASRNWDFVVLQEQSQIPAFPPSQVASDCYPYAAILVDSIRSNYSCTEPIFFMTWGRQNGDAQNCQFYPPLCTFGGMNARLRESYLEMGLDNESTVAPCGAAWAHMAETNNWFWGGLYSGDGSHPSAWGTYLNACVFYATIFRQSPVGIPYYASIGQTDAEDLQELAALIVLDSLSTWYIGHQDVVSEASFSMINASSVQFSGANLNATTHSWNFGDGQSSNAQNPVHVYASEGDYTVMHIASSDCDADTTYLEVSIAPLSVNDFDDLEEIQIIQNENTFSLDNTLNELLNVAIFDVGGRLLRAQSLQIGGKLVLNDLGTKGVYLIQVSTETSKQTRKLMVR